LTDFIIATLIYHASLEADNVLNRALMPLLFRSTSKNKGIRARWVALLATKGNLINKGCMLEAVRRTMLSGTELLGLGN
jgi:hypothetical protein